MQFLRHLVGSRVADVGEAVVDFPEEAAELEGRVYVAVAHAAYAHAHQLARQVRDAQQVVGRRYLEGQYARACPCNLTFTLQRQVNKEFILPKMASGSLVFILTNIWMADQPGSD